MDCFQILNQRQFQTKGWDSPRNEGFRSGRNRRTHPAVRIFLPSFEGFLFGARQWRGLAGDVVIATTDRIGMAHEGAHSDAYLQLPYGSCRCSECSTHCRVPPTLRALQMVGILPDVGVASAEDREWETPPRLRTSLCAFRGGNPLEQIVATSDK